MWKPNNSYGGRVAQVPSIQNTQTPYNAGSTAPQQQFQQPQQQFQQQAQPTQAQSPWQPQTYGNTPQGQAPTPPPQQMPPQNYGNAPQEQPPRQFPENPPTPSNDADFINTKICKVNARDKVMDLKDMLVKANPEDYANIHGCGGKGHAPNSGICLTLCDYSKGKGDKSVTVKAILDVRQIDRLLSAVEAANNGVLGLADQLRGIRDFANANGMVIGWLQSGHQPSYQELAGLQQTLANGLTAQDPDGLAEKPAWSWEMQKANPYGTKWENGKEYAPTTWLTVSFYPGQKYQWRIKVVNCMAPLNRKDNGSINFNAKDAIGKTEVMFPITTENLYCALSDAAHYIRLWEHRMYPVINAKCTEREKQLEEKKNNNRR